MEVEFTARTGDWTIRANATFQDTEDRTTGQPLLRRPDEKGSLTVDRQFSNGSWIGVEGFASGPRQDVGGTELPGYGIVSLRAGWSVTASITLEMRLENLLDESYEPASGFNAAGRSAFLSLDWRG